MDDFDILTCGSNSVWRTEGSQQRRGNATATEMNECKLNKLTVPVLQRFAIW